MPFKKKPKENNHQRILVYLSLSIRGFDIHTTIGEGYEEVK